MSQTPVVWRHEPRQHVQGSKHKEDGCRGLAGMGLRASTRKKLQAGKAERSQVMLSSCL